MSRMDFNENLAHGLGLGMQLGQMRQQHELAISHLLLAQQEAESRRSLEQARIGQTDAEIALRQRQDTRRETDEDMDRAANLSMFDSMDQQPDPNVVGVYDDAHPGPTVGGKLGISRAMYGGATPATQRNILEPIQRTQRDVDRLRMAEDMKQKYADTRMRGRLAAIEASSVPEPVKERLRVQVQADVPGQLSGANMPITSDEWLNSPEAQRLSPSEQMWGKEMVDRTGVAPPSHWFAQQHAFKNIPNQDPDVMKATDDIASASSEVEYNRGQLARATAEHARWLAGKKAELAKWDKANYNVLDTPLESGASKADIADRKKLQDARDAIANDRTGEQPLLQAKFDAGGALLQAQQKKIAAHEGRKRAVDAWFEHTHGTGGGGAAPGGAPAGSPSHQESPVDFGQSSSAMPDAIRSAVAQVAARFPNLDPDNPADAERIKREVMRIVGGNPNAKPTGQHQDGEEQMP